MTKNNILTVYLFTLFVCIGIISCSKNVDHSNPTAPIIAPVESIHAYMSGIGYGNGHWVAKYWKDTTAVILSDSSHDEKASSVFVTQNSDVYIAGYVVIGGVSLMEYWKNGISVPVTNNNYMDATGIAVSGSDIYICGSVYDPASAKHMAEYWKNGTVTYLSNGPGNLMPTL